MKNPIVVEQEFDRTIQDVWTAITIHEHMVKWFFEDIPEFRAVVGFETAFDVISNGRVFRHLWRIEDVKLEKMIRYNWQYEAIEGEGKVTFDLSNENGKTILRLINTGLESFPKNIPEFSTENCVAGWTYFIKDKLYNYLLDS